jgi:hypothetical protein
MIGHNFQAGRQILLPVIHCSGVSGAGGKFWRRESLQRKKLSLSFFDLLVSSLKETL